MTETNLRTAFIKPVGEDEFTIEVMSTSITMSAYNRIKAVFSLLIGKEVLYLIEKSMFKDTGEHSCTAGVSSDGNLCFGVYKKKDQK